MGGKGWIVAVFAAVMLIWGVSSGEATEERGFSPKDDAEQTVQVQTQDLPALEFPYVVRGTELIVQKFTQYEGPFPLDGSGEPLAHVAALMIYNPGKDMIADAQILVHQGQETLRFSFTYLPSASRILVLENTGKAYENMPIVSCSCSYITKGNWNLREETLEIWEDRGHLRVENTSGEALSAVTLYYKQYIADGDFYLGGETWDCTVKDLVPGESREVLPKLYAPGYTKIVSASARYKE